MKTILISGCSYSEIFSHVDLQDYIKQKFNVEKIVNLSRGGSSVDRQIKVAMEWLSDNPFPELVLMPLTHIERYDDSVSSEFNPGMAYDESLCVSMPPFPSEQQMNQRFPSRVDLHSVNNLLKYKTLVYNNTSAFNNFLTKIIAFSGWLQSKKIRHLMFNMCNKFEEQRYSRIKKQLFLKRNKNVIDIYNFIGNKFMHDNLTDDLKNNEKISTLGFYCHHYGSESNKPLIDYLNSYIIKQSI
jgi:hypothetical protein